MFGAYDPAPLTASVRLTSHIMRTKRAMKTLTMVASVVTLAAASLAQTNRMAPLYVHFGMGADSTKRLLTARIHFGDPIFVGGDDYWKLTGLIDRRGTNVVADLTGDIGSQS
jgi:hypothetical protein